MDRHPGLNPGSSAQQSKAAINRWHGETLLHLHLASKPRGSIYIGVTSDLVRRVWQHKEGAADSHTKRYWIKHLVYFEEHATAEAAIGREKQLKGWRRAWKDDLIEAGNRDWRDLYGDIAKP